MSDLVQAGEAYVKDSMGRLVPSNMVSEVEKLRDEMIVEIVIRATKISQDLASARKGMLADVLAFMQLAAERYDVKIGGLKGNVTLTSFDGRYRVVVAISDRMAFSEGIHTAKALVDECISRWAESSSPEIKVLVQDAFQVDKAGTLNTHRILSLARLQIRDPTWVRGMDAIRESIIITGSKSYIRVYERNALGKYAPIPMDIAAV